MWDDDGTVLQTFFLKKENKNNDIQRVDVLMVRL